MAIYTKVTDAEGNETYVEADEVAIVRENNEFKETQRKLQKANNEAKNYRLAEKARLTQAQSALNESDEENDGEEAPATKTSKTAQTTTALLDEEALLAQLEARLEAKRKQQADTDKTVSELMTQYNVPAELLEVVRTASDPKTTAELLGKNVLKFAGVNGGRDVKGTALDEEILKAEKALGFTRLSK